MRTATATPSTDALPGLKVTTAYREVVRRQLDLAGSALNILEAGCGRLWPFEKRGHTITGIDLDADALEYRNTQRKDLDHAIVGDLRTVPLPTASFDVIYSSFVLEHVEGVEAVLERFVTSLKPGGLLILTFPDLYSVYGFCARITPFWVHVAVYRYFLRKKNAGKPGFAPYPTVHERVLSRPEFRRFIDDQGLSVVEEYGFGFGRSPLVKIMIKILGLLSLGTLAAGHTNLLYILRKNH
jgi:SAM-dependent methyltransferase